MTPRPVELLSIIIPAHNESENLGATITALAARLEAESVPYEILVVNDHSTDETTDLLRTLEASLPTLRWVENRSSPGFGNAVHAGLGEFRGDAVCIVMADASDDPADVVKYYRRLGEGYECVFGSRFSRGSVVRGYPLHKLVINRLANWFVRVVFRLPLNDVTNAFKAYRREVIEGIQPILSHHFNLTVELPLKAIVRGYTYAVIPINWYGRLHGVSKLKVKEMGSRYLFIVLYVLLEKLLSRGDYHRDTLASAATRGVPDPTARRWLWPAALGLIVLFHALFVLTYPLNDMGGDTSTYLRMMVQWKSSLVHAGGYPFLFGLPLRPEAVQRWMIDHPRRFRYLLAAMQHALDIGAAALLYFVFRRVWTAWVGVLAALLYGLDIRAMGATSSVYPEWLQAVLLAAALSLGYWAVVAPPSGWKKPLLYSLSGAAFTWCCLAKFNLAVLAVVYLLLILVDRAPLAVRLRSVTALVLSCFGNFALYLSLFHYPSTHTRALTADRSWVFMAKLADVLNSRLDPANGPATERWLCLSSFLPSNYDEIAGPGMFESIDAVPLAVRAPYRARLLPILAADAEQLHRICAGRSLPANFQLWLSSVPISHYIGLRESDVLGQRVFWEAIRAHPQAYIRSLLRDLRIGLSVPDRYPIFPTEATNQPFGFQVAAHLSFGFDRYSQRPDYPHIPYSYFAPVVWRPGLRFFSELASIPSARKWSALIVAAALGLTLWKAVRARRIDRRAAFLATLAVLWLLFAVSSSAALSYRWKEQRAALPMTSALTAMSIATCVSVGMQLARRGDRSP